MDSFFPSFNSVFCTVSEQKCLKYTVGLSLSTPARSGINRLIKSRNVSIVFIDSLNWNNVLLLLLRD
jgi:hypothetical protein